MKTIPLLILSLTVLRAFAQTPDLTTAMRNQLQLDEHPTLELERIQRSLNPAFLPLCKTNAGAYIGGRLQLTSGSKDSGRKWAWAVFTVDPDGPLPKANIKAGDLFQAINGQEVPESDSISKLPVRNLLDSAAKNSSPLELRFSSRSGEIKNVSLVPKLDCGIAFASTNYLRRYYVKSGSVYYPQELTASENERYLPSLISFELALTVLATENRHADFTTINLLLHRRDVDPFSDRPDFAFDFQSLTKSDALALAALSKTGYDMNDYKHALSLASKIICGPLCLKTGSQGNFSVTEDRLKRIDRYIKLIKSGNWEVLGDAAGFKNPMATLAALRGDFDGGELLASSRTADKQKTDVEIGGQQLPRLSEAARAAYVTWLLKPNPKAFAVAPDGRFAWASGPQTALLGSDNHPHKRAMKNCEQQAGTPCKYYAIDEEIVVDR